MSTTSSDLDRPDVLSHSHTGSADAGTVAAIRHQFSNWMNVNLELDEERTADILLAADEALANCADHAYRVVGYVGNMTLQFRYDAAASELKVCVSDHGTWVEPDPAAINAVRGRGLLLMQALADECTVDGRQDGTTVCLRFYGCRPRVYLSQAS